MATAVDNGVSYTLRNGTSKADKLTGGLGNDWIVSGAGNDTIVDLLGRNIFDAGAGSDIAAGGLFNDVYIHRIGENVGFVDRYDGSTGRDTLRLELTTAEWAQANVQADIAAFQTHVNSVPNKLLGCLGLTSSFQFSSTNLRVTNIEALEVRVGGQIMNLADEAVMATADTLSTNEDASRSINLLTNDTAPDRVASIQLIGTSTLGTLTLDKSLETLTQSAMLSFTPTAALQTMAEGETRTEVISYKITDADGDVSTANVTITVEGRNDAPVARADQATTDEDAPVTIDVLANDTDVDAGDKLTITAASVKDGLGTVAVVDGKLVYDSQGAYGALDEGDVAEVTLIYTVKDNLGVTSTAQTIVTVTGANDGPLFDSYWTGTDNGTANWEFHAGTTGNDYMFGNGGKDWLSGDGSSIQLTFTTENFQYSAGNDRIIGDGMIFGDLQDRIQVRLNFDVQISIDLGDDTISGSGEIYGDANYVDVQVSDIRLRAGNDIIDVTSPVGSQVVGDYRIFYESDTTGLIIFGDDRITGGSGNDLIVGDAMSASTQRGLEFGNDVISGGGGDDELYGDLYSVGGGFVGGDDLFVFGPNSGNDVVGDFGFGADKLDVSAYGITKFSDVEFTVSGGNTVIDLDGTAADIASITLQNYTALKAADFIFDV